MKLFELQFLEHGKWECQFIFETYRDAKMYMNDWLGHDIVWRIRGVVT
jgi:hypothetical protein